MDSKKSESKDSQVVILMKRLW